MGIVVSKRPYSSVLTSDPSDSFSSINMPEFYDNNGMSMVNENGIHREHFRRVLKTTSTRGVAFRGDVEEVSKATRRSPQ